MSVEQFRPKKALPPRAASEWTTMDEVRLLTCQIAADLLAGRVPALRVATTFWLPQGEVAVTNGPVRVLELRAAGDGSYVHTSGFAFGTGALGVALLAGSLMGNAAGNTRRRRQAEQDARLAFRHQFDASVFVTTAGFVFQDAQGVGRWGHGDINTMQMLGPSAVAMQGDAIDRSVTWQLLTPWAELIFVAWALRQHPHHPQLVDGSWLMGEWLHYARMHGRDPRLVSTVLTPVAR